MHYVQERRNMKNTYVISKSGTSFAKGTPKEVIDILDRAIASRMTTNSGRAPMKLRLWFGNPKTGKDWMEVYDVFGYISRTYGDIKVPILIKNRRSIGGGAILTDNIVKITWDKKVLYQNPNYHQPELTIKEGKMPDGDSGFMVFAGNDVLLRCCKKKQQAENEIAFHKGLRNVA